MEREEEEKQNFLNDLLAFKQKYQQLEEENRNLKRQSKIGNSDIAKFSPIIDKSYNGQTIGNSLDDYERYLSQMRGVNRFWKFRFTEFNSISKFYLDSLFPFVIKSLWYWFKWNKFILVKILYINLKLVNFVLKFTSFCLIILIGNLNMIIFKLLAFYL